MMSGIDSESNLSHCTDGQNIDTDSSLESFISLTPQYLMHTYSVLPRRLISKPCLLLMCGRSVLSAAHNSHIT